MITAIIYMLLGALMLVLLNGAISAVARIRKQLRLRWMREGAKAQRSGMVAAGWTAPDWSSDSAYTIYA